MDDLVEDDAIVPRRPLSSGFNPWDHAILDRNAMWQRELIQFGVEVECEACGKRWRVHPVNANKAKACSNACRNVIYRRRKKEGTDRPLHNMWWKPWERRKINATD